jgi:exodeoxyribonuclease III
MKILNLNVNGLRSSIKKGLIDEINRINPDIICAQELKAQPATLNLKLDLDINLAHVNLNNNLYVSYDQQNCADCADTSLIPGYYFWGHYAQKKGYSGVGIFSKILPNSIVCGLDIAGFELFNNEGRYIKACFDEFDLICSYFPSGSSGDKRVLAKYDFLDIMYPHLLNLAEKQEENKKPIIICGDFNIAHNNIDLKNWKGNLKNPGFLPRERKFMDDILANNKYIDIFRSLYPNTEQYSWWSQRGNAFDKDIGWRIDYFLATNDIAYKCHKLEILKQPRLSDHAILLLDIYD